jgi:Sec-independent protein translocase protein TatA
MFGIGGGEIVVIALVALILFGNEDLPKHMRKLFKAWNDFRGVTNDLQRSWLDVRDQVTRDLLTDQTHSSADVHPHPVESSDEQAKQSLSAESDDFSNAHSADEVPLAVLPSIKPAQGTLAQGPAEPNEEAKENVNQNVNPNSDSDKST